MIRVGILGDIGSGKSYVAKNFGYPVFNADTEVRTLYKKDKQIFNRFCSAVLGTKNRKIFCGSKSIN